MIYLCRNCIEAIRSRGEKLFVGHEVDFTEYADEHGKEASCEWCEDNEATLYECEFY